MVASASAAVVLAALIVAGLVLLRTRRLSVALPVLLDLLLVAGLLRLSATGSWRAIATAATITMIRKLATVGIGAGRRARVSLNPDDC